jgi:D-arabinose 1-dehydrogenase-like Zn-dependent alcohol dehydrogenase
LSEHYAIDYQANEPLHSSLAKSCTQPFGAILDTVGSQDVYEHSPEYLKQSGVYVNVGSVGISTGLSLWRWFKNSVRPSWLGGVSRMFIMFNTFPVKDRGENIANWRKNLKLIFLWIPHSKWRMR